MKDKRIEERIQHSLNAELSGLRTTSYQRDQFFENATGGYKVKKKISVVAILVAALMLFTVTALAVVLLSPKEIVEQVAVPTAQSNEQENYTYEDLQNLLQTLNENGITLDEGSTLMQAFKAGHGYWERDTIDEICRTAFGRNQGIWTLEQKHWYGEMMKAIGAWGINIWLLPEGEEISLSEARALAVKTLKDAYGAELPAESNEDWEVYETFELAWQPETDSYPRENAQWTVWFSRRNGGSLSYDVTFDRFGQNAVPWRASFLEHINTKDLGTVMDDLEEREGTCTQWSLETWAEFGNLISDMEIKSQNGWLYQHAGYCLPPEGAISAEEALEIARKETGASGWIGENIICCIGNDRPIYKICQRVFLDGRQKGGRYDHVWCLEIDCMTGEVLDVREYTYTPDSNPMMMYVPFSLLSGVPSFEKEPDSVNSERRILTQAEKESAYQTEHGAASIYFLPLEKQAELFGGFHTVPSREEYDKALATAKKAIASRYGADALETLGDYQTGVMHQENSSGETGEPQHVWDFMFTTDPTYLSDGYRVQFRYPVNEKSGEETVLDLTVEHANLGNG